VFNISQEYRADVLAAYGAVGPEIEELLLYNKNIFTQNAGKVPKETPLPDEPFVAAWDGYAAEAMERGVYEALKRRLIQFQFPVRQGISQLGSAEGQPEATGLFLEQPEQLELIIYQTPAGRIPLLITRHRADFVTLVQALAKKNEPVPVPDSMGAMMVTGYNNWDRIFMYKKQWEAASD